MERDIFKEIEYAKEWIHLSIDYTNIWEYLHTKNGFIPCCEILYRPRTFKDIWTYIDYRTKFDNNGNTRSDN